MNEASLALPKYLQPHEKLNRVRLSVNPKTGEIELEFSGDCQHAIYQVVQLHEALTTIKAKPIEGGRKMGGRNISFYIQIVLVVGLLLIGARVVFLGLFSTQLQPGEVTTCQKSLKK